MRQRNNIFGIAALLLVLLVSGGCKRAPGQFSETEEALEIYPDYTSIVLPPNIAPLNFHVENPGSAFIAEIRNSKGRGIRISGKKGNIQIPLKSWRRLLDEDRGGELTIEIYRKTGDSWEKFAPVQNMISSDEIDAFIAFRKIPPANIIWKEMGIYQRSLEDFREDPIMVNSLTDDNCMHCHSFNGGDPEQFMFHMRGAFGGTFVSNSRDVQFVNTSNDHTRSAGAYPSWHPGGELIAFSVNKINQSFHSRMGKIAYVVDRYSDIVFYDVGNNRITRPEILATDKLENLPVWSADGKSLYYLCAPEAVDTAHYSTRKYNLMNIPFELESGRLGLADTLISARQFGKSISFPRENPSHPLLAFIGLDYGYFSIYNNEADVYFMNLESGEIVPAEINSEFTESYPSWSSGGSWLMFVSKRDDGLLSQPWFCHVDADGKTSKPFVLPQKDPGFYKDYLYNYNRPEFIRAKVDYNPRKIFSIIRKEAAATGFDAANSVSLSTGATIPVKQEESGIYSHE